MAAPQLLSLVTHVPSHAMTQAETLARLDLLAGGREGAKRFRGAVERSRIQRRHVETPLDELLTLSPGARSRIYEGRVREVIGDVGARALAEAGVHGRDVSVVVTISCTGYMMPSVDAYVMPRLGISNDARRVPVTELGCSGGVAALGIASELLTHRPGAALVASIEMCSSCMQTEDLVPSDVIGNILFADAAAAVVIGSPNGGEGPQVIGTRTVLWPDTTDALGMRLSDTGFRLVLSPNLPEIVESRIPETIRSFLREHRVEREDVGFWVIHPGGPRVLEAVGRALSLTERALGPSWATWERYGNVSSATVFFILRALHRTEPVPSGRLGVMMAFGPGLSCELLLLRSSGWLARPA